MQRLTRGSSGLRHLRWAREILATLEAHAARNPRLDEPARAAMREEAAELGRLVDALSSAVKPYRDFLERERVKGRGAIRVGVHLCAEALGEAGALHDVRGARARLDAAAELGAATAAAVQTIESVEAAAVLLAAVAEARRDDEPRREALSRALEAAIDALRSGLDAMDRRLGGVVSPSLVASVYPELTRGASRVADEGDANDDAAAGIEDRAGERRLE